jgi:carbon starvation protein
VKPEFARHDWLPGSLATSGAIVLGWGVLIWGGSISTLWPMFGVANQLLACVALCVATSILFNTGKGRYSWTTILPLAFISVTTLTAGWMSVAGNFWPMTRDPARSTQGWVDTILTSVLMLAAVVVLIASTRKWLDWRHGRPPPPRPAPVPRPAAGS